MKNSVKSITLMITALLVVFTSCGGGGSDNGGGGGTPAGMFTKTIDAGAGTQSSGLMSNINPTSRWQSLYLAGDIGASGRITGISFQYLQNTIASVSCPGVTIKLSHSNLSALSTTFASNLSTGQGGQKTVLSDATIVFPAGAKGTWHTIHFTTPFDYNGVDNLIIEFNLASAPSAKVSDEVYARAYDAIVWTFTDSATGSSGTWLQEIKFNFTGGDNRVDFSSSPSASTGPLTDDANRNKVQVLYTAAAIAGSGRITGIALQLAEAVTFPLSYKCTVRLGYSNNTDIGLGSWDGNFSQGSPVTVANYADLKIPNGTPAGTFVWLPLNDGVFTYDGTNNLVVEITTGNANGGSVTVGSHTTGSGIYHMAQGSSVDTSPSQRATMALQIALRFYGGTVNVIGNYNGSSSCFNASSGGNQFMVRAAELGSSGSIDRIAFRLANDSVASDYTDYSVTLAHSTQSTLAATDVDNISGGTVVYKGAFSIPVGLKEGDWIEIPLSTPFNYNGEENLVIQAIKSGGSANNWAQISHDSTWFAGCYKSTGGSSPGNYRGNFKFWVNK